MRGVLWSPFGRVLQALVGVVVLWLGIVQLTVAGLFVMITGLVITVTAAAPPAFLVPAPVPVREGARRGRS